MLSKRRLFILLFAIPFIFTFNHINAQLKGSLKDVARKANSLEDIFTLQKKIILEKPKGAGILMIRQALPFDNGDIAFRIEGKGIYKILLYDEDGEFLNPIGEAGYDKEDYFTPSSIAGDNEDNIYILDPPQNRINVFTKGNSFVKNIPLPGMGLYLLLNSRGEIYLYSWAPEEKNMNCIIKYSPKGKLISEFASFPNELLNIKFMAFDNTFCIDQDDFVYEVNPLWSRIRKYNSSGQLIMEFGSKKVEMIKGLNALAKEELVPRTVSNLFVYKDLLLLIYDDNICVIYDLNGMQLNSGFKLSKRIIACSPLGVFAIDNKKGEERTVYKYEFAQ